MNRRIRHRSANWLSRLEDYSPQRFLPWLRNHLVVAHASLQRLLAEPLQTALTASVIAIAMALPAMMLQFATLAGAAVEGVSTTSDINVFFDTSVDQRLVDSFYERWSGDSRFVSIILITPEQGLLEFESYSGLGSVLSSFENNPLPWVARISPSSTLTANPAQLQLLVQALGEEAGVHSAQLDFSWLDRLNGLVSLVDRLSVAVGLMLAAGIILILGNTIRLTIENRRDEILVIKLVGGTDRYVARPLLYTGFWYGLMGAFLASILVAFIGLLLSGPLQRVLFSYQSSVTALPGLSLELFFQLLFVGGLLGCSGAALSVLQNLRQVEPR